MRSSSKDISITNIHVVCDLPEVFLKDLSGMPIDRYIEFSIKVTPGTHPISKSPYRMVPVELKELRHSYKNY